MRNVCGAAGVGGARGGLLPVDAHRAAIVASVRAHTVTVIRGDTGCGKSRSACGG
jgi:hypothetical protein